MGGWSETFGRTDCRDPDPVLTMAMPETVSMDSVMRIVTEALNRQQESFMKMMEDRDFGHRRNETVGENAGNGPGDTQVVMATEGTRGTGEKEKEKATGCSYKTFLACKPPEFVGTTEPVKCIYWLKEMEMAFEASECNENQRVGFASHLLKGEALDWWDLIRSSLAPGDLAQLSWVEFKRKLLKKLSGLSTRSRMSSAE